MSYFFVHRSFCFCCCLGTMSLYSLFSWVSTSPESLYFNTLYDMSLCDQCRLSSSLHKFTLLLAWVSKISSIIETYQLKSTPKSQIIKVPSRARELFIGQLYTKFIVLYEPNYMWERSSIRFSTLCASLFYSFILITCIIWGMKTEFHVQSQYQHVNRDWNPDTIPTAKTYT